MKIAALVVLLAGCHHADRPVEIVGNTHAADLPAKGPETVAAHLQRTIGGGPGGASVAILPAADGLVAVSASGLHRTVLVPGAIGWALVDPLADVVWFATEATPTTVLALDLEGPAGALKPHVVVTGAPGGFTFEADHPSDHPDPDIPPAASDMQVAFTGDLRESRVIVRLASPPTLAGRGGVYDTANGDEFAARVAREAKLGDTAWLAQLAKRPDRSGPYVAKADASIDGVDASPCTADAAQCGKGSLVTGTKYANVVVVSGCGDGCSVGYRLYDFTTKQPIAAEWGTWLDRGAVLAPDRSGFVADGVVVRFDRGPLGDVPATEARRRGGGWLAASAGDVY